MSLRDEAIGIVCSIRAWPYTVAETEDAITIHPTGPVAMEVKRVEVKLTGLLRRQREACLREAAPYLARVAGEETILNAEIE